MSKKTLKRGLGATGDLALVDTDRRVPKADGGTYDDPGNVRLMEPRAHMEHHGTLREREEELARLKAIFDDRVQTMKLVQKIRNQLLAYQRRVDDRHPETEQFLLQQLEPVQQRLAAIDRDLDKAVAAIALVDPLVAAALRVPRMGSITVAALTVYVDLNKAASASSLWAYAGLDKPAHARYTKGASGGGNKTLRTVLYNTARGMQMDMASTYRPVYDRVKRRLEQSERGVKSRNTQGHWVECAWKDTKKSHRHGAAIRAVMKHVLADYWFVGRELLDLPTRPLYVQEQLGHEGIIKPRERGWVW